MMTSQYVRKGLDNFYKHIMQGLFSQNTGYIIQRLQTKLKFQADEINHLRQQLDYNASSNRKRLEHLFQNSPSGRTYYIPPDQSTQDSHHLEETKLESELIENLTKEIMELERRLKDGEKARAQASSEALLNKQVLIEEQMFFQEISSGYEEKIMELRRMLQDKEILIESKMINGAIDKDMLVERKIRREFLKAEEPLILRKIIEALQQRLFDEINIKDSLEKELKELKVRFNHADQVYRSKFNKCIDDSFITEKSNFEQDLILFDDERESSGEYHSSPCAKNQKSKSNSSDTASDNGKFSNGDCCKDLRLVLAKMSVIEDGLKSEVKRLKHHLEEMSCCYNTLVKGNLDKDSQMQILLSQNYRYKSIIRNSHFAVQVDNRTGIEGATDKTKDIKLLKDMAVEINKLILRRQERTHRKCVHSLSMPHLSNKFPAQRRPLNPIRKPNHKHKYEPFILECSSVNISDVDLSRSYFRDLQQI